MALDVSVASRFANPTPERGGKRKRYFRLLAAGERALADSAATAERLLDSWKILLVETQTGRQKVAQSTSIADHSRNIRRPASFVKLSRKILQASSD